MSANSVLTGQFGRKGVPVPPWIVPLALVLIQLCGSGCDSKTAEEARRLTHSPSTAKALDKASLEFDRASRQIGEVTGSAGRVVSQTASDLSKSASELAASVVNKTSDLSGSTATLAEQASTLAESAGSLASSAGHLASDELEKAFAFEYRVVTLPNNAPSGDIESALSDLGRDRWECFNLRESRDGLQVFCKRRPKSYLEYISHLPTITRLF